MPSRLFQVSRPFWPSTDGEVWLVRPLNFDVEMRNFVYGSNIGFIWSVKGSHLGRGD